MKEVYKDEKIKCMHYGFPISWNLEHTLMSLLFFPLDLDERIIKQQEEEEERKRQRRERKKEKKVSTP